MNIDDSIAVFLLQSIFILKKKVNILFIFKYKLFLFKKQEMKHFNSKTNICSVFKKIILKNYYELSRRI